MAEQRTRLPTTALRVLCRRWTSSARPLEGNAAAMTARRMWRRRRPSSATARQGGRTTARCPRRRRPSSAAARQGGATSEWRSSTARQLVRTMLRPPRRQQRTWPQSTARRMRGRRRRQPSSAAPGRGGAMAECRTRPRTTEWRKGRRAAPHAPSRATPLPRRHGARGSGGSQAAPVRGKGRGQQFGACGTGVRSAPRPGEEWQWRSDARGRWGGGGGHGLCAPSSVTPLPRRRGAPALPWQDEVGRRQSCARGCCGGGWSQHGRSRRGQGKG